MSDISKFTERDWGGEGAIAPTAAQTAQAAIDRVMGLGGQPRPAAAPSVDPQAAIDRMMALGTRPPVEPVPAELREHPAIGALMRLGKAGAEASGAAMLTEGLSPKPEWKLTPTQEALYWAGIGGVGPIPGAAFMGLMGASDVGIVDPALKAAGIPATVKSRPMTVTGFEQGLEDLPEGPLPVRSLLSNIISLGLAHRAMKLSGRIFGAEPTIPQPTVEPPAPPIRLALPPRGGTTGPFYGPPHTFEVSPTEALPDAERIVEEARTRLKYPPGEYALPREGEYETFVPPPRKGGERIQRLGETRVGQVREPSANRPDLQTSIDIAMERAATLPETTLGDIAQPSEVFRGIRHGRPLDEMPTQLELAQARVVSLPEPPTPEVKGIAKPPGVLSEGLVYPPEKVPPGGIRAMVNKDGTVIAYMNEVGDVFPGGQRSVGSIPKVDGTQVGAPGVPKIEGPAEKRFKGFSGGVDDPTRPGGPIFNANVPIDKPPYQTYFQRLLKWWRDITPASSRLVTERPNSTVNSRLQEFDRNRQTAAEAIFTGPESKLLHQLDPEEAWLAEHRAYGRYRELTAQGIPTAQATAQAVREHFPPTMQRAWEAGERAFLEESRASQYLREKWIPHIEGPYWPRLVDRDAQDLYRVHQRGGGFANSVRQTVDGHERGRQFATALTGRSAANITYEDPRISWAHRRWVGLNMTETANLIHNLEQDGVLFRDATAARAASLTEGGTGRVWKVEGVPGAQEWWTRTASEAQILRDHLSSEPRTGWGAWMNAIFRAPNLINPFPHQTKNIFYKYLMAKGNPVQIATDLQEYARGSNPALLARYDAVLPITQQARTAEAFYREFTHQSLLSKLSRVPQEISRPSAWMTFTVGDPATRYALWKTYLRAGLTDQAAANNVLVDLINYGERSKLIDFWKATPGNFFVPWRVGTVISLAKQMENAPLRTALYVLTVDYMREMRYRQTGRYTHLPIDYLEVPIAQSLYERNPATIAGILAMTTLFGPGGGFAASTISDVLKAAEHPEEAQRLLHLFWGLSQIVDSGKGFYNFTQDGNPQHLSNLLSTIAIGERSIYYKPHRILEVIPESWPGMQKSERVKFIERYRDIQELRHQMQQQRRDVLGTTRTLESRTGRAFGP